MVINITVIILMTYMLTFMNRRIFFESFKTILYKLQYSGYVLYDMRFCLP
jgi:hypothetical protein